MTTAYHGRAPIASPLTAAAFHIGTLFPPDALGAGEHIELRAFRGKAPGPREFHRSTATAVQSVLRMSARGFDVFTGAAPRRCPDREDIAACPHTAKGGKSHIARIGWAFVEIDAGKGEYENVAEVLERLDALAVPPDMVIASGSGAHAYFRIDPPISDVARFERLTRALRRQLGHDPAVDISRVLRVAGTVNHKYAERPVVSVVRWGRNGDD